MTKRQAAPPIRIESILCRHARRDAHQQDIGRRYKFADVEDHKWPVEVWRAVEGDLAPLLKLLRGGEKLGRPTRNALADWLEGKLPPVKLPRGHPRGETKIGWAWYRYDGAHEFIRRKGWHRKGAARYWTPERLLEAVATKESVSITALRNKVRRASGKNMSPDELAAWARARVADLEAAARRGIAREIRSRK